MKNLPTNILALSIISTIGLASCSSSQRFEEIHKAPEAALLLHPTDANGNELLAKTPARPFRPTPSAKAAGVLSEGAPLLECRSESCRINCSSGVAKASRPKWCSYFKAQP